MRVILLQDVDKIGKQFEVKDVSPGYARNFLIPKGLAKEATKETLEWLAEKKEVLEEQAEEDLKKAQTLADSLDGQEIIVPVKIGEEKQLFESITPQKVVDRLKENGFEVKKSQVILETPIKELGEFPVKIRFSHNLEIEIKIIVIEEKENA